MAKPANDKELVNEIGIDALAAALGRTEMAVKKWAQRGIPWKDRRKVAKVAAAKRIKLPPNFDERRAVA